jgi:hypothetical protein
VTVRVSGAKATEFSETSPTSIIRIGFVVRRTALVSMSVQNSIVSTPVRSAPEVPSDVRMERHRCPGSVLATVQRNAPVTGSRCPPTESG